MNLLKTPVLKKNISASLSKKNILFFDGECAGCSKLVLFLSKRDKNKTLFFAPINGKTAKIMFPNQVVLLNDNIVLAKQQQIYAASDALLHAFFLLGKKYKIMKIFFLVPKIIRNSIYFFFAKNRYKIFGKQQSCELPRADNKNQFLE